MRTRANGFTLVEILVVLTLVAVLSAILLGVFGRVREKGRRTTCAGNLRQLNLALRQYLTDNDSVYPDYERMPTILLCYVKSRAIFECPTEANTAPLDWNSNYQTDYELNAELLNTNTRLGKSPWRGDAETKTAHIDSSRLWTLADSNSSDNPNPPEIIKTVPSTCGGAWIESLARHGDGCNYAFADGHVKWLNTQGFADIYCYAKSSLP